MSTRNKFLLFLIALLPLLAATLPQARASSPLAPNKGTMPVNEIAISFDQQQGQLTGTSKISLPAGQDLTLRCGPLRVTGALLEPAGSTPAPIITDQHNNLTLPATPVERVIYVSWSLQVPDRGVDNNLISERGITLTGFWHPLPDRDMLYRLSAELPAEFTGISEADELTTIQQNKNQYLQAAFNHPLRSINFVAGPYEVSSRQLAGGPLLSAYFFPEDTTLAEEYLDYAADYLRRYSKLLGPYPFHRFSIVENRLPTGYAMPTFTLLGQAVARLPFIKRTSLGHEILHSWFGNGVRPSGEGGNWSEGLTSYLSDHLYAADGNEGTAHRKKNIIRYVSHARDGQVIPLTDFTSGDHAQPASDMVRAVGYDKGAMVFHMLRNKLEDELFFKGLRVFYEEKKYQRATWADIEKTFSTVAGEDLSQFFAQWLQRNDIPILSLQEPGVEQQAGRSRLSFRIVQGTEQPYERLLIPILINTVTGPIRKELETRTLNDKYEFFVDSIPTEIIIDPDYDLMRLPAPEELPPTWSRLAGASDKTIVLPAGVTRETYEPLVQYLTAQGYATVEATELENSDIAGGSFIFVDDSAHSRHLFATPRDTERSGFVIDIRNNPLNPREVIALVQSDSAEETLLAVRKLRHYGQYGFLHFSGGRLVAKKIIPSRQGMHYALLEAPGGMPTRDIMDFSSIINDIAHSRVIYIGETHTDYGAHILQLQIIQALFQRHPDLAVGMEMFPRSAQAALDSYINGEINDEKEFLKISKYYSSWGFDYRLYRDIIAYAKKHNIPLIGLNLDKKIVNQVFRDNSLDNLSAEQLASMAAQRDLDLPGYRQRLAVVHGMHQSLSPKHDGFNGFFQSQAIWDETMAETVADYLRQHPDKKMVVVAGGGHVYKNNAIPPRVSRRLPNTRQSVLIGANHHQLDITQSEEADYLLRIPDVTMNPAGKIGVSLIEEPVAEKSRSHVKIVKLDPRGKADEAGIKVNDIILAVSGEDIQTIDELKINLLDKAPGDTVTLKILRRNRFSADREMNLEVKLSALTRSGMMMPPTHPKVGRGRHPKP